LAQPITPFFATGSSPNNGSTSVVAASANPSQPVSIRQILNGPNPGQVTLIMDTQFSDARVQQVSEQLGTSVIASYPAFGQYVLAIPRIQIMMDSPDSGTVYFPILATPADINTYLGDNQLIVTRWLHSLDYNG